MSVKFKLQNGAILPQRQTEGAVGYDLYANENTTVENGRRKLVSTGVCMDIPSYFYGRIAPRSSLAAKHGIDIGAGIIDNDYRGEVKVLMINNGFNDFDVKRGDRIAQLIFEQCGLPEIELVEELSTTVRNSGGFGSTGK